MGEVLREVMMFGPPRRSPLSPEYREEGVAVYAPAQMRAYFRTVSARPNSSASAIKA
jgi:hypothetical protein